jgi:DNA-binding NarL/FixJ family response regulator
MAVIRVLLANHPQTIPSVVKNTIAAQPDMEVVGEEYGPMQILQHTGSSKAQVVILCTCGMEQPGLCSHLLSAYPAVTILCIASDLTSAFVEKLYARRDAVPGTSLESMMQSIRLAVQGEA